MAARDIRILRIKVRRTWHFVAESKSCYRLLAQQVLAGMQEASEAFDTVSASLMHIMGLKANEMREEGRASSVLIAESCGVTFGNSCTDKTNFRSKLAVESKFEYEANMSEAELASAVQKSAYLQTQASTCVAKIAHWERRQIRNLVAVLKAIEASVQFKEQELAVNFSNYKKSLAILHQQFKIEISNLPVNLRERHAHRLTLQHTHGNVLSAVLKIQEAVVLKIIKGLSDLETDFEDMLTELAASMCKPLISYLKDLKSMSGFNQAQALQGLIEQLEFQLGKHIEMLYDWTGKISQRMSELENQFQFQDDKMALLKRQLDLVRDRQQKDEQKIGQLKQAIDKNLDDQKELKHLLESQSRCYDGLKKILKKKEAECLAVKKTLDTLLRNSGLQNGLSNFERKFSELNPKSFETNCKFEKLSPTQKKIFLLPPSQAEAGQFLHPYICKKHNWSHQNVFMTRILLCSTCGRSYRSLYYPKICSTMTENKPISDIFRNREDGGKEDRAGYVQTSPIMCFAGSGDFLHETGTCVNVLLVEEFSKCLYVQGSGGSFCHNCKSGPPLPAIAHSKISNTPQKNIPSHFLSRDQSTSKDQKDSYGSVRKIISQLKSKLSVTAECLKKNENNILRSKASMAALRECCYVSGGNKLKEPTSLPGKYLENVKESLHRLKRSRNDVKVSSNSGPHYSKKHKIRIGLSHSENKRSSGSADFNLSLLPEKATEVSAAEERTLDASSPTNESELWKMLELGK